MCPDLLVVSSGPGVELDQSARAGCIGDIQLVIPRQIGGHLVQIVPKRFCDIIDYLLISEIVDTNARHRLE